MAEAMLTPGAELADEVHGRLNLFRDRSGLVAELGFGAKADIALDADPIAFDRAAQLAIELQAFLERIPDLPAEAGQPPAIASYRADVLDEVAPGLDTLAEQEAAVEIDSAKQAALALDLRLVDALAAERLNEALFAHLDAAAQAPLDAGLLEEINALGDRGIRANLGTGLGAAAERILGAEVLSLLGRTDLAPEDLRGALSASAGPSPEAAAEITTIQVLAEREALDSFCDGMRTLGSLIRQLQDGAINVGGMRLAFATGIDPDLDPGAMPPPPRGVAESAPPPSRCTRAASMTPPRAGRSRTSPWTSQECWTS